MKIFVAPNDGLTQRTWAAVVNLQWLTSFSLMATVAIFKVSAPAQQHFTQPTTSSFLFFFKLFSCVDTAQTQHEDGSVNARQAKRCSGFPFHTGNITSWDTVNTSSSLGTKIIRFKKSSTQAEILSFAAILWLKIFRLYPSALQCSAVFRPMERRVTMLLIQCYL